MMCLLFENLRRGATPCQTENEAQLMIGRVKTRWRSLTRRALSYDWGENTPTSGLVFNEVQHACACRGLEEAGHVLGLVKTGGRRTWVCVATAAGDGRKIIYLQHVKRDTVGLVLGRGCRRAVRGLKRRRTSSSIRDRRWQISDELLDGLSRLLRVVLRLGWKQISPKQAQEPGVLLAHQVGEL